MMQETKAQLERERRKEFLRTMVRPPNFDSSQEGETDEDANEGCGDHLPIMDKENTGGQETDLTAREQVHFERLFSCKFNCKHFNFTNVYYNYFLKNIFF